MRLSTYFLLADLDSQWQTFSNFLLRLNQDGLPAKLTPYGRPFSSTEYEWDDVYLRYFLTHHGLHLSSVSPPGLGDNHQLLLH